MQLIDYAGSLKLDTIQISSLDDYESLEPAHLQKVKDQAARYGMKIDGGIGCICPTSGSYKATVGDAGQYVLKGLRVAKAIGARPRCAASWAAWESGAASFRSNATWRATIKVLRGVRSQALDIGVKVAIENHNGDLTAREVKTIIEDGGQGIRRLESRYGQSDVAAGGSAVDARSAGRPMW